MSARLIKLVDLDHAIGAAIISMSSGPDEHEIAPSIPYYSMPIPTRPIRCIDYSFCYNYSIY